jgi:flagellar biosynthetic protein FlhB
MADKPAAERTEQPTPERLRKARGEGRIPQSTEVSSVVGLAALLIALALAGPWLTDWLAAEMRQGLSMQWHGPIEADQIRTALHSGAGQALAKLAPFLIAGAAASVLGCLVASGWTVAPKAIAIKFERMHPIQGMKNLLSLKSAVHLLVSTGKLVVIALMIWWYLRNRMGECLALAWATPSETLSVTAGLVFGVTIRIGVGLTAIAAADLLYQRWNHKRELRMTRQEVKQERKEYELSPELRGRIRRIQLAMASKRMLQDVPTADVVVTNPTHVAVALRYDAATMQAPQVVAKGADLLSDRIKEIAREHNVPIIERPQLARSLFAAVEVGQAVPQDLFVAVAEVLAMLHRLRRKRLGQAKAGRKKR